MFFEKLLNKSILLPINLLVGIDEFLVLIKNALENHLTNSREWLILIVLTNGEVNVISLNEFLEHSH